MASYPLLELTGSAEALEIATALLIEHGCLGTEEQPEVVRAYFADATNLDDIVEQLGRSVPAVTCRIAEPVADRDWLAEWKAELDGFTIGSRYFVLPTWKPDIDTERTILRLDPEQAFGTGTHETTQLCVGLIEDYVVPGCSVIDVGTGTGILSMVAAHEGAGSIRAVDVDPAAVECARANIERNRLADRIRVECSGWEASAPLEADVIVANINTTILARAVHSMYGTLLLSGILVDEVDELLPPEHSVVVEKRTAGEWAALVIRHG